MKLLLDSHILVWAVADSPRLPKLAAQLLRDHQNEFYFSTASIWEVAIKAEAQRQRFEVEPRILLRTLRDFGHTELTITSEHTLTAASLPPIHKDPFDRLLVAQSIIEGITLLTVDATVATYPAPTRKV